MIIELNVRRDIEMTTFGQRVKKAWKNIDEIKPKNIEIDHKKEKNK
jgi:hypothetical protein